MVYTGDRYLLKLFRDFVLHQVREDGSPMLDWGHVVECLNKLDAGVPEKVLSSFSTIVMEMAFEAVSCTFAIAESLRVKRG